MKENKSKECCFIDYETRCECSDDDRCGCSYPNNVANHITCKNLDTKKDFLTSEDSEILQTSVCYCDPKICDCRIEHWEAGI